MYVTFEAKPDHKAGSKSKKMLKTLCKGTGQVLMYCKSAVVKYFVNVMKREVVFVSGGAIYKYPRA